MRLLQRLNNLGLYEISFYVSLFLESADIF